MAQCLLSPTRGAGMSLLPWFSLVQSGRQRSAFFRYGITASSVGLSLLAGLWLRPFSYRVPYLPFIASILISLLYGGVCAGITATIPSDLVSWPESFGGPVASSVQLSRAVPPVYCVNPDFLVIWRVWCRDHGYDPFSGARQLLFLSSPRVFFL